MATTNYANKLGVYVPEKVFNSYNVTALRNVLIETNQNDLRVNKRIGQLYCRAYDDDEWEDMTSLLDDDAVFTSMWGVTQGLEAAKTIASEERERFVLTFTTPLRPLTDSTFFREGTLQEVDRSRNLLGKYRTRDVIEYLSVVKGYVTTRTLALKFNLKYDY